MILVPRRLRDEQRGGQNLAERQWQPNITIGAPSGLEHQEAAAVTGLIETAPADLRDQPGA